MRAFISIMIIITKHIISFLQSVKESIISTCYSQNYQNLPTSKNNKKPFFQITTQ